MTCHILIRQRIGTRINCDCESGDSYLEEDRGLNEECCLSEAGLGYIVAAREEASLQPANNERVTSVGFVPR